MHSFAHASEGVVHDRAHPGSRGGIPDAMQQRVQLIGRVMQQGNVIRTASALLKLRVLSSSRVPMRSGRGMSERAAWEGSNEIYGKAALREAHARSANARERSCAHFLPAFWMCPVMVIRQSTFGCAILSLCKENL